MLRVKMLRMMAQYDTAHISVSGCFMLLMLTFTISDDPLILCMEQVAYAERRRNFINRTVLKVELYSYGTLSVRNSDTLNINQDTHIKY